MDRAQHAGQEDVMGAPRGTSEQTRGEILKAARELFATRGITEVTVRDIAAQAGVTHALVHRYFGTKEEMIAEILRREVQTVSAVPPPPNPAAFDRVELIRQKLVYGLTEGRTTLLLLTRAELAGLQPETMLDHREERPLGLLTDWLREQQAQSGRPEGELPDPALVGAIVGGASFALQLLGPWLMTAVGLDPGDAESRRDDIVAILLDIICRAAGLPATSVGTATVPAVDEPSGDQRRAEVPAAG
jgi:AcrR family transcriptional regulator